MSAGQACKGRTLVTRLTAQTQLLPQRFGCSANNLIDYQLEKTNSTAGTNVARDFAAIDNTAGSRGF